MKQILKKINGFTMMEIVITILLSLLLFSILYFSYAIIEKNVKRSKSELTDILSFKQRMQIIFDRNDLIVCEGNYLLFNNIYRKSLLEFCDNSILLSQESITDTLYRGHYNYFIYTNPGTGLTDQLLVEFYKESPSDTILLCLSKNYLPAINLRRKEVDFDY